MKFIYFPSAIGISFCIMSMLHASHSPESIERKAMMAKPPVVELTPDELDLELGEIMSSKPQASSASGSGIPCPNGVDCRLLAKNMAALLLTDHQIMVDEDAVLAHLKANPVEAYIFQHTIAEKSQTRGKIKIKPEDLLKLLKFTQHATNISTEKYKTSSIDNERKARLNRLHTIGTGVLALASAGVNIYLGLKGCNTK